MSADPFPDFSDRKAAVKAMANIGIGSRFHHENIKGVPGGEILARWFTNNGAHRLGASPGIIFRAGQSLHAYDLFIHLAKLCFEAGVAARIARLDEIADAYTGRSEDKLAQLQDPRILFVHPFQDAGQSPLTVREQRGIERILVERIDARKGIALFTTLDQYPWWSPSTVGFLRSKLELVSVA